MITSLNICNFKCFERLDVDFGQLTLLTGFNSGGKSSALQPLLLLAQAMRAGGFPVKKFPLNGKFVRLGSVGDVIPMGSRSEAVDFTVSTKTESRRWTLRARPGERSLSFSSSSGQTHEGGDDQSVFSSLRRLSFIGAVRQATPDDYPVPDLDSGARDVGADGRYAAFEYNRFADEAVLEERRHSDSGGHTVRKVIDEWMSWLFPGAGVNVQFFSHLSLLNLQFRTSEFGEWRRPANVGYGYSYAFPIVVALVTARVGQTIVIDSPEAHLHPRAQSRMGWLLAKFAQAGVQVVVESHSDHVLNGMRLAVHDGALNHQLIKVIFFAGEMGAAKVFPLIVDKDGGINRWPEGFFDQMEHDLSRL
ncbi:AAA family ATPase [Pseudoxanthomonas daejeonensis]|uniref:ATPase n=1 Tax=Pseudoxanthomonas daejeonensis TaxID=266062 RepID=A0ABQ6ZA38_9GAMM|nr:DUF3696 domain-containing protein [Pseudoxanthomonas daejeonensis]KAF1696522.1 ATPase [Pseudoxanthomonas daejeonensis]